MFDTGTVVPGVSIRKCVGTKLVKASLENIRFYQHIIQQIQTGARCNYELALRDAFQFFRNSNYSFRGGKRGDFDYFGINCLHLFLKTEC